MSGSTVSYPVLKKVTVKTSHFATEDGRKFEKYKGTKKEKPEAAIQGIVDGTLGWYVPTDVAAAPAQAEAPAAAGGSL